MDGAVVRHACVGSCYSGVRSNVLVLFKIKSLIDYTVSREVSTWKLAEFETTSGGRVYLDGRMCLSIVVGSRSRTFSSQILHDIYTNRAKLGSNRLHVVLKGRSSANLGRKEKEIKRERKKDRELSQVYNAPLAWVICPGLLGLSFGMLDINGLHNLQHDTLKLCTVCED